MGPLGADIEAVKKQIDQLKIFKAEVDPHMVKVEALNRSVMYYHILCFQFLYWDFSFLNLKYFTKDISYK